MWKYTTKELLVFIFLAVCMLGLAAKVFALPPLPELAKVKESLVRAFPENGQPGDDYRMIGWVLANGKPYLLIYTSSYSKLNHSKNVHSGNRLLVFDQQLLYIGYYPGFSPDSYKVVGQSKIQLGFNDLPKDIQANYTIDLSKGLPATFYAGGDIFDLALVHDELKQDKEVGKKYSRGKETIDQANTTIQFDKNIVRQFSNYKVFIHDLKPRTDDYLVEGRYADTLFLLPYEYELSFFQYGRNSEKEDYKFEYLAIGSPSKVKINGIQVLGRTQEEIIKIFGPPTKIYEGYKPGDIYLAYGGDAANDYVFMDFQIIEGKVLRCTLGILPPFNNKEHQDKLNTDAN